MRGGLVAWVRTTIQFRVSIVKCTDIVPMRVRFWF